MNLYACVALCALLLATAFCPDSVDAQDTLVAAPASAQPPSDLPPIFAPRNKVLFISSTLTTTFLIHEVRGDWVLVSAEGATPAWIHPASSDASWSLLP